MARQGKDAAAAAQQLSAALGSKKGGPDASPEDMVQMIWEEALTNYNRSLKLEPNDQDAKNNYEFVRKKIEELQKEKEKQKNQDQNKDQKPSEDAKKAKEQADAAVRNRQYKLGLE